MTVTGLSKAYDPKKVEDKIYKLWQKSGFFAPEAHQPRADNPNKNKSFTIVIPPPNITGELHMGHALNAVIQDILIRQKRMQGFKTLWLPGTDHAGIATQNVVEKELKKEGKTRFDLGRELFIERVWAWRKTYGNIILDQLKKIGASCDWSRTRFTLDKDYVLAVKQAFLHYYKKGWIYQGERTINWCPRCSTSLSDLELEYKEEKSHLWYIRYPLRGPASSTRPGLVVATTRPETMLGDTAVAVNPNDKRYKSLVGKKVILPLANRAIPIIADRLVDPKFGTGAVKVTPAHDLTDYEIGLRHKLKMIQVIDETAKMTKEAPQPYQGLKVLAARQKVVDDLKNLGLLERVEDYTHQIPKCYRCSTTVELIPSEQWFLKMDELAKVAIKAVKSGKVKFTPRRWEKIYFDWLSNIKDWCISRQIWWGHRLPVYEKQEEILNSKSEILNKSQSQNFKNQSNSDDLEIRNSNLEIYVGDNPPNSYIQVPDVLDTWFSSALWPFATLGWPASAKASAGKPQKNKKSDLEEFYPTDVLSTARDIINLWVARMVFSGLEFTKKAPFKTVLIHPTVLTKEGKRMSKSLGTGIDPINLIEKYGADATRFGIAYQLMGGQDIHFVEDNIVMGRKFCNKLWNASRFVLMNQRGPSSLMRTGLVANSRKLTTADKKILKALDKTVKSVNKDLENYSFGQAAHTLYNFFWHDFCDKYIEEFKKVDKIHGRRKSQLTLIYALLTSLKLLHPFIPFITEEIYQKLPLYPVKSRSAGISLNAKLFNRVKNKKQCLMIEEWPGPM